MTAVEQIIIDPEFKALIPPLSPEERQQLEANLRSDGCLEPLIRWKETKICLDGHNRKEICDANGIIYTVADISMFDRPSAMGWIIRNQFGRRNLSDAIRAELALKLEDVFKAKARGRQKGGQGGVLLPQNSAEATPIETREEVAKIAGVSHDTISKVKVTKEKAAPEIMDMLRKDEISIRAARAVADAPIEEQKEIAKAGPEAVREKAKAMQTEKAAEKEPAVPRSRGKALDLAYKAISFLQQIPPDDGLRDEAFDLVVRWLKHNRKGVQ